MNQVILKESVSSIPLFSELSGTDLSSVCSVLVERHFDPGAFIVNEEDKSTPTFFIINSGSVNVIATTKEGNNAVLARLKRGDFFGEMAILDGEPRSASVVAAEPCVLIMLYRKDFLEILQRIPKIAIKLLIEMSHRLRNANRHINTLSLMSVYGRIADVLLRISREQGREEYGSIVINNRPTHQMIAEMAGTSRETVTRILSKLQKKRIIRIAGKKIIVFNQAMLLE